MHWLARRNLPLPAQADNIPALFRDEQHVPIGLFDDDVLIGCLFHDRRSGLSHWGSKGAGSNLFLRQLHTLPDRPDDAVRLITLWASDYAARSGLPHVRAEAPADHRNADWLARLLRRVTDMGWQMRGLGHGETDERVVQLELRAEARPGLTPLIRCAIAVPPGDDGGTL
ncbi:hypothetical protein ACH40D_39230 [Streptomyces olivaceoviridis]|uniref:Uncharacterized protein n=1 Tax=Streptomyces olivaceoviridis TaxID=1921 RepID=A0ABW7VNJ6_STROI|nr:hypothetical protein [Streptomyces corchorusii]